MADSKISALTEATSLAAADEFVVASSGATKRVTAATLLATGWVPAGETWTYASPATFTVSGDVTAKYEVGTRLRFKQGGGYKYVVVVGATYGAPNTTVTVTGGSDYSVANSAITDNDYSRVTRPPGWPGWFTFATSATGFSSVTTDYGRFMIAGRACTMVVRIEGTSNAATFNMTLPVTCAASNLTAYFGVLIGSDNGTTAVRRFLFTTSTNCRFDATAAGADGWTASGTKNISANVTYEV